MSFITLIHLSVERIFMQKSREEREAGDAYRAENVLWQDFRIYITMETRKFQKHF